MSSREGIYCGDSLKLPAFRLLDRDLDFLIQTASPGVGDTVKLKRILREDAEFRRAFVGRDEVFRRVMDQQESFLRISPALFFEILLRRAVRDLGGKGYTFERDVRGQIPIFDTKEVLGLLADEAILVYLAEMLASFTRIQSFAISFRLRPGVWQKIRFNDLDVDSLIAFAEAVAEEQRLAFYKRIGDICLFVLGVFPTHPEGESPYPFSGKERPSLRSLGRMPPSEYEEKGRRFYGLAAEHAGAEAMGLGRVFAALHKKFHQAKKPLNFVAEHYLPHRREMLFS